MNLGFVAGESAVAVIDSGYGEAMARAMLAHIRRITDRPVRYLINTNSQPHRIMGNPVFRHAGAEIIAAAGAVPRMTGEGPNFAATVEGVLGLPAGSVEPLAAPDRALEREAVLDLGGVSLRLLPVGHAHTAGSLVAAVEPGGLVFAADIARDADAALKGQGPTLTRLGHPSLKTDVIARIVADVFQQRHDIQRPAAAHRRTITR